MLLLRSYYMYILNTKYEYFFHKEIIKNSR